MALAFVFGLWSASRRARQTGVPAERILDVGTWLIVGAIIGARTLYVISYWREEFAGKPFVDIFMIQRGGLVYYGGLIGACAAGIFYSRFKKIPLWQLSDILAPSIALGYFFGRIGCLMNGCCYGRACSLPWAIQFPATHPTYPEHVHPTEIYESLLSLGLFFYLSWLFKRRKFNGQIFATYLVIYAVLRSFVEMFRGDYPQRYVGGLLTPAHLISIAILLVGLVLFWVLPRITPQRT
jgi:phosphatidylglycerol:prolipoprotein diacylglycerol transferase